MKALIKRSDGACGVADIEKPECRSGQLLVRVQAASFNRADYGMGRKPYLVHEGTELGSGRKFSGVGADLAGIVVEVGEGVGCFSEGDRIAAVAPGLKGAVAEFVAVDAKWAAHLPSQMRFSEGAALPSAGVTALAGVRKLSQEDVSRVLVVGASGGVGQYATILAKAAGFDVGCVVSERNRDVAIRCGASRCYHYDGGRGLSDIPDASFDAALVVNGKYRAKEYVRTLRSGGSYVAIGLDSLSPDCLTLSLSGRKLKAGLFFSLIGRGGLTEVCELLSRAEHKPLLEIVEGLDKAACRFTELASHKPQGKVVVSLEDEPFDRDLADGSPGTM